MGLSTGNGNKNVKDVLVMARSKTPITPEMVNFWSDQSLINFADPCGFSPIVINEDGLETYLAPSPDFDMEVGHNIDISSDRHMIVQIHLKAAMVVTNDKGLDPEGYPLISSEGLRTKGLKNPSVQISTFTEEQVHKAYVSGDYEAVDESVGDPETLITLPLEFELVSVVVLADKVFDYRVLAKDVPLD